MPDYLTEDEIRKVVAIYRNALGPIALRADTAIKQPSAEVALSHARFMCDEIDKMLEESIHLDKPFRWLGFLQGVLWTYGIYSIDDLRGHIIEARK